MRANRLHPIACQSLASVLLGVVCASTAAAQLASSASTAAHRSAQTYRISGRVVDAHSGVPIARCMVEIVDVGKQPERPSGTMRTGEDGHFSFDSIPASKYRLSASKSGYLTESYEQHDEYSTAIAAGPGLISEDLLFKLTPGAIVSGTITDEAGEPVRQAQIQLYRDQDTEGIRSTQRQNMAMTDDRGVYELANIAPGAYFLSVSAHPWYAQRQPGGHSNADLDVAYPTTFYPDVTDGDAATPIPVKGGERLQADFTLHAERAMRLRLPMLQAAMNTGYGVSVTHSVFGEPESVPQYMVSTGDSGGGMEIDGLLPGHYDVDATKTVDGHSTITHLSADVADGAADISSTEGNTDAVVTGKVISSAGPLPQRAGMALVVAHSRRAYFAPLDDAGEFTVNVPPGTYEVLGQINGHYLASVSATGATLVGRLLTVKSGTAPRLQVVAANSYGRIDGVVMHDGHHSSAAMVLLVPDHPAENHILFRRDQSDSDGTFTLSGILPGHYRLVAIERGWELEWANPHVLAPFLRNSTPLDVRGKDQLQQTIELQTR